MITQHGFSLLELLITLTIAAILATVAYPLYVTQVTQSKRAEGAATILQIAAKQETYYQNHGGYTNDMTKLGYSNDPATTANGFYTIDATLINGGQGYLLTATRAATQVHDNLCGNLTYSSLGLRSAINNTAANPAEQCW